MRHTTSIQHVAAVLLSCQTWPISCPIAQNTGLTLWLWVPACLKTALRHGPIATTSPVFVLLSAARRVKECVEASRPAQNLVDEVGEELPDTRDGTRRAEIAQREGCCLWSWLPNSSGRWWW